MVFAPSSATLLAAPGASISKSISKFCFSSSLYEKFTIPSFLTCSAWVSLSFLFIITFCPVDSSVKRLDESSLCSFFGTTFLMASFFTSFLAATFFLSAVFFSLAFFSAAALSASAFSAAFFSASFFYMTFIVISLVF
jgi:hypothetical protein